MDFLDRTAMDITTEAFDKNISLLIPHDMNLVSEKKKQEVANLIKKFYAPSTSFTSKPRQLVKVGKLEKINVDDILSK